MVSNEQWVELRAWHEAALTVNGRKWFRMCMFVERNYNWPWLLELFTIHGGGTVARGKSQRNASGTGNSGSWTKFVEIPLTGVKKADIEKVFGSPDVVSDTFEKLVDEGYRMSFSKDYRQDAVICSVTCKQEGSPNEGCTFTAFAGSWFAALQVALYKHFVVSKENWNANAQLPSGELFG